MQRLTALKNQVAAPVLSSYDYLNFDSLLTPEEAALRKEVRAFMENEIAPKLAHYVETATFPEFSLELFKQKGWMKHFANAPYGTGARMMLQGLMVMEMGRIDASIGTFFTVQACLAIYTVQELASDEQKQKYLKKMIDMDLLSGWGLTEMEVGSDASNLQTSCRKVEGGYLLNGNKRWIGNGNRDICVVWARDQQDKKVKCFIVNQKAKGVSYQKIQNKMGLRCVENMQIHYKDAFVPESDKMEKAKDWMSGTNKVLKHSRIIVAWNALGVLVGCYDACIKYVTQRKQFGVPVAGFQLIQERLARMMGDIQACLYFTHRVTILFDQKKATMGQIALCKAQVTRVGREVARIGRECLGGNGIIHDNYLIKAINDMEAMYTYEGTYDVNSLIVGRELTGLNAFKNSAPVQK